MFSNCLNNFPGKTRSVAKWISYLVSLSRLDSSCICDAKSALGKREIMGGKHKLQNYVHKKNISKKYIYAGLSEVSSEEVYSKLVAVPLPYTWVIEV